MAVTFFFLKKNISLTKRKQLKAQLAALFKNEGRQLKNLNYIFCSDEYLLKVNQTHLRHNYYTDIITFDLSENQQETEGEIYISTDRVRENAQKLKITIKEEVHRVVFHGALHLCGYKDKTKSDKAKMRSKENHYLEQYFTRFHVKPPTIAPRGTNKIPREGF